MLENGQEQRLLVVVLRPLEQGLQELPEQAQEQRLLRCELRKLLVKPQQFQERALVRLDERRLEQGLHIRLEPGLVRVLLQMHLRLLLGLVLEGHEQVQLFPQWSGEWGPND